MTRPHLEEQDPDVVVLGLGNVLLTDDGVGIVALHRLARRFEMAEGVRLLDGGTLGLALLSYIENAPHLVLLDAIRTHAPPGSLVRLDGDQVGPAVATRLSPHQIGVADLLAGASWLDRDPGRVVLLGLVPESFELATERSVAVEAGIDALVDEVVSELVRIGYPPRCRARPLAPGRFDGEVTGGGGVRVAGSRET